MVFNVNRYAACVYRNNPTYTVLVAKLQGCFGHGESTSSMSTARSHRGGAAITSESVAVTTTIVEPVGSSSLLDTAIAPEDCSIRSMADVDKVRVSIKVGVPAPHLVPQVDLQVVVVKPIAHAE